MEVFTAFAGELERSIAWGSGGFTTLRGAVARLQRGVSPISPASVSSYGICTGGGLASTSGAAGATSIGGGGGGESLVVRARRSP